MADEDVSPSSGTDGLIGAVNQGAPVDPRIIANLMAGLGPKTVSGAPVSPQPPQPSLDPNIAGVGQPQADTSAIAASGAQQLPPMIKGGLPASAQGGIPQPTIGGLPGLIMGLVNPGRGVVAGQQAPSKLSRFEDFAGNFLVSLAQGLGQEGTGPGAAIRGAAAAMQAPYQQAMQHYQLQQQQQLQQAQVDIERSKARSLEPSIPVIDPNSGKQFMVPPADIGRILAAGYRLAGVRDTNQTNLQREQIRAKNRLDVEGLKVKVMQGTATKFVPDAERDPQTGETRYFYHVWNKFGQEIGQADVNTLKEFMSKSTQGFDLKQGPDGSFIRIPKITTNTPMIPFRRGTTGPAGETQGVQGSALPTRKAGGQHWMVGGYGMAATPVVDSAGNAVFGKEPENIRTMASTAAATLPHMDDFMNELDEMEKLGVLGEFKGKGTAALTKYGFGVPGLTSDQRRQVGKFIDDVKLIDSAMLRTHFGARGGQQMYEKFSEMLNAGEDPDLLRGGIDSFRGFLTGYRDMVSQHPIAPKGGGGAGATPKGMVMMQAPNGQLRPVPADQVSHYESLGAKRYVEPKK